MSHLPRRTLLTAALSLAAPALVRAAPSGEITVVGFFGIFEDNFTKAVIQPFMQANPGIKVNFRPVRGSADSTALLRTARGRPSFDVVIMDLAVAEQNARDSMFAPLDPAVVTNLVDIPAWGRPAGNFGAALTQDLLVLLYTPAKVKTAPQEWLDLADPVYAGRLGLPIGDVRGTVLLALLDRGAGADYKTDLAPGLAALKRIAANVQSYEPQPDPYTAIRSGLMDAGIGWNARGQANADQSNGAFAVAIPLSGTAPQVNAINLVAKAPNPEAAQVFINHALSAPAQKAFAEALFYGPTNTKAVLDPALTLRIFGPPASRATQMTLDWEWFSHNNNALVQRIRREIMAA